MNAKNKQQNNEIPRTPLKFIWFVLKPVKGWVFLSATLVIVASIISTGVGYWIKLFVEAVETAQTERVVFFAIAFPLLLFLMQLLFRLSGYTMSIFACATRKHSFDVLSEYTLKHSHSYFINRFSGSLLSKVSNVNNAVDKMSIEFLFTHLTTTVSFIVTAVLLGVVDARLSIMFLLMAMILFFINIKFAPKKRQLSLGSAKSMTDYRGFLVDVLTNMQAVRQYVNVDKENVKLNKLSTEIKSKSKASWFYTEHILLINTFILLFFSIAMFWLLVSLWQKGSVDTSDLVLVIVLYYQIAYSLLHIGRVMDFTARSLGEIQEGLEDILIPFEVLDNGTNELSVINASIEWTNVNFEFAEQPVFKDFNLSIEGRQKIGLVGESGAGKSTFVSLLLREYDINDGEIEIDGQDISSVTQDSLRKAIAVVPQEPALFHRSIYENIAYGKPNATRQEVFEVAVKAQAHEFICTLPDGYDTLVGERGVKLSGGQKQRVAIARAMLKDAPILVLDEATSALDSESEVAIQKALEVLMEDRTVIAIAHRLSTLRKMDRIIVMEEGKIIEDGDHDSLSQAGGVYERLWNHQAGGFLKE